MTSRRGVLKGGIAAAVAATLWHTSPASTPRQPEHVPDHLVLDADNPISATIADYARAAAIPTFGAKGDISALWFETLDPLWRRGSSTVAGVTSPEAIFCLERLAWDHGMRMIFRADAIAGASAMELRLRARPAAIDHASSLLGGDPADARAQAACLLHCPIGVGAVVAYTFRTRGMAANTHWVSWLMAPRAQI